MVKKRRKEFYELASDVPNELKNTFASKARVVAKKIGIARKGDKI